MNISCIILCAEGFAENSLHRTLSLLKARQIKPIILGLRVGSIIGATGRKIPTDALISHYIGDDVKRPLPNGFLIAGGRACGNQLLVDPRVYLLIKQMHANAVQVGFLFPVLPALYEMLSKKDSTIHFPVQEKDQLESFLHSFIQSLKETADSSSGPEPISKEAQVNIEQESSNRQRQHLFSHTPPSKLNNSPLNNTSRNTTLIATVGGQPQVVTFALDSFLAKRIPITQLILIHLASDTTRVRNALHRVVSEIDGDFYRDWPLKLELFPIHSDEGSLTDIQDEADAHVAWESINQLIIDLKEAHHTLHVCISGGRRMLSLMAMSVAMLHFGHQDMLWHIYTPTEWRAESRNGGKMHLPEDSGLKLIQVPMMPWGSYFPVLRQLTRPITHGQDVLAASRRLLDYGEEARKTAVRKNLTRRQIEVLNAFAQGLTPQEVAEKLVISVKTVDSHKTVILAECRNVWALPDEKWLDYRFIETKFTNSLPIK